jgi:uncharacterized protein (DUF885 family)
VPSVSEVSDAYVDRIAAVDPVGASRSLGVARDATSLTDYSPEGFGAMAGVMRTTVAELDAADPVDDAERLGAGFLRDHCEGVIALTDAGERQRMVSAIVGPQAAIRMSFDLMPRETHDDWAAVAARLGAVPEALRQYRASLAASVARGDVAARRVVEAVAEQCETWAGGWFSSFIAGQEGVSGLVHSAGAAAAAYGELAEYLRRDYLPEATDVDGVGADRYRVWAQSVLGTDLDVDEAYAWAVDEWDRLEAEKAVECDRIDPGAGFDAVRAFLDAAPDHGVDGVDAFRSRLQELTDEAIGALAGVEFDIAPELRRCEVSIPPEGSASAPYYTPPSEDLTQPGQVWFPTVGRTHFELWSEVTTVYHEAVPGHHLQLGATRLLPLTRAHRLGFNTGHGEGWALYAERLMDELGWFSTPATRLGFLCMQAMRAARVVVDIGLHCGKGDWTYDKAVDAMQRAGALSPDDATSEVLRYLSWPSQATGYKLGERSWLAGRAAAMAAAGAEFDRKDWHGRALALGPLGLDRLERELAALV